MPISIDQYKKQRYVVTAPHKTSHMSQNCLTNANGDKWGLFTVRETRLWIVGPNKVFQSLRLHSYRVLQEWCTDPLERTVHTLPFPSSPCTCCKENPIFIERFPWLWLTQCQHLLLYRSWVFNKRFARTNMWRGKIIWMHWPLLCSRYWVK